MMFVAFNNNTTSIACEAGTANPSKSPLFNRFPVISMVGFAQSLVF